MQKQNQVYLQQFLSITNSLTIQQFNNSSVSHSIQAQVAHQQGKYIAKTFNSFTKYPFDQFNENYDNYNKTFRFTYKGTMAYIGGWRGVISLPHHNDQDVTSNRNTFKKKLTRLQGIRAWLFWRSVYFTMLTSTVNRILIPMYWFKAWIFGRDFSRF